MMATSLGLHNHHSSQTDESENIAIFRPLGTEVARHIHLAFASIINEKTI